MKALLITVALISLLSSMGYAEWMPGYVRSDGTYVDGYYKKTTETDKYSPSRSAEFYSDPNINPYTGRSTGSKNTTSVYQSKGSKRISADRPWGSYGSANSFHRSDNRTPIDTSKPWGTFGSGTSFSDW